MAAHRAIAVLLTGIALAPATTAAKRVNRYDVVAPHDAKLERMAWCESRKRWQINTHNGYLGGLQFDLPTWRSVGGRGMPHRASRIEQKFRAVLLIRRRGYAPWPVCGRA